MKLHHTITTSFSICLPSIQTKKMRYKANCEDEDDEEEAITTTTQKKKSPPTILECFSIYHHNHFSHRM